MEKQREALITQFVRINEHTNLSAIRDPKDIEIKHIQDSLELNKILTLNHNTQLCDVGTGGGFPLLPIAMTNPSICCTGIDARRKKIDAIMEMVHTLKLANVKAIRTRAEDHTQQYEYVTARAVGYIQKLVPQLYHLIKKNGVLVLYKQYTKEEEQDIKTICKEYHMKIQKKHTYTLFENDITRVIYIIQKQ